MNLSSFKNFCFSGLKAGSALLEKTLQIRPKPDGLDFFSRPITAEEAKNLILPDKIASFIQARRSALSPLAKMVMNNLTIAKIEPDDREKFTLIAKCQYRKFTKIPEEFNIDIETVKIDLDRWGIVFDDVKKELWTPMTLNTTGQITNYELLLNGVAIGYLQFMEKSYAKRNFESPPKKLEIEAAFGIEFSQDSLQVTDLSIDPAKTLWALNVALLSADKLRNVEQEIESGIFVYCSSLLLSIMEKPKPMFTSDIKNISFVVHHTWTQKMIDIGLIEKGNLVEIPNIGKYYGIPTEYIRIINFTHQQLQETSVKMNYLRTNKLKEAV